MTNPAPERPLHPATLATLMNGTTPKDISDLLYQMDALKADAIRGELRGLDRACEIIRLNGPVNFGSVASQVGKELHTAVFREYQEVLSSWVHQLDRVPVSDFAAQLKEARLAGMVLAIALCDRKAQWLAGETIEKEMKRIRETE